jgi:hypothetical protein
MATDPTPEPRCIWCHRLGHAAEAHPLPKDHPQYDAFYDATDDELAVMVSDAIAPGRGDHPHTDPGDGRTECDVCGKWVFEAIHSCKGVPVTQAAWLRHRERTTAEAARLAAETKDS